MIFINFSAEINPHTSEALMSFFAEQINNGENEFYIMLSSFGGSVKDGITLYNYIKALPAKVIMHNIGMVNSIANVIFLAAEDRYNEHRAIPKFLLKLGKERNNLELQETGNNLFRLKALRIKADYEEKIDNPFKYAKSSLKIAEEIFNKLETSN